MTPDQRFSLIIAGLGLVFAVISALITIIWRAGTRQGETTTQIKNISQEIKSAVTDIDRHIQWHIDQSGRRERH